MVMGSFFIICGSFAVFLILVGFAIAKLYKRATRETALVKTGAGGKSVIIMEERLSSLFCTNAAP